MPSAVLHTHLARPVPNAPLVSFRVVFGAVMLFSTLRFSYLGWIDTHFVQTRLVFSFFGFEWVRLLPPAGMYALHVLMVLGAAGVMLGAWYRLSAVVFFLSFTYTWLIDLTYYLNHYYFVSLVALLLIGVPAHRRFSIDAWRRPAIGSSTCQRWATGIFQLQIAIVYVYAGLAKINHDWLLEALPLRIWAPANDRLPLIGWLFTSDLTPWVFSWAGMIYDCTIVFWLSWRPTRLAAYLSVIFFHAVTGMMFQIGVFPLVMIGATWIFFPAAFHERLLGWVERHPPSTVLPAAQPLRRTAVLLGLYFAFQLLFPWRYLLYPGNLFWTEEGYRFSWRVMLMEKAGTATFYVQDRQTGREGVVVNSEFLSEHQEKQMAMQPDMILQYAHFLAAHYASQGVADPRVRAEVYVTLNARPSRLLIDPQTDLTRIRDSWAPKTWILPYSTP
ncbi:MAG: HTTM domain-containing protein [Bacteroidia bacterium]